MHGNLRWRHYLGIRGAWQPQVEALFGDKRCMTTSGGGIIGHQGHTHMLHLIITSESTSGSAVKEKKKRIDE